MDVSSVLAEARDAASVGRVFGAPINHNGVTVVPVAKVMGGGGAGEGTGPMPEGVAAGSEGTPMPSGMGGGFGVRAVPAGVYVLKGDDVRWLPAVDVNRIVFMGQIVAIVFLLVIRGIAKARRG